MRIKTLTSASLVLDFRKWSCHAQMKIILKVRLGKIWVLDWILVVSLTLVSSLVKLATQFILANYYNPLGPVVRWSKHLGKIDHDKCKCLLILQLVVANSKHLKFSTVPSQINLHLIHILQFNIMEDFYFHQYHSLLFVVVKIIIIMMKQNNESTDLDCLHLATSRFGPAHWFVKTVFSR